MEVGKMCVQRFFLGVLLLTLSTLMPGCYTQFATSDLVERKSPSEAEVKERVDSNANVTINNYYDFYYARFLRPTIYGFGSIWWYDPFWDYSLWYAPAVVYYGWSVWGWNRWVWALPVLPYWGGGSVAVAAPTGARRIGIGRLRLWGGSEILPLPIRHGASSEVPKVVPSHRRQREGLLTVPADASCRSNTGRAAEQQASGAKERYSSPSQRQASGEQRTPSYSAPLPRSAPPAVSPSHRRRVDSYGASSSGTARRRQR